jgi:NitT/TauT family transport system substrate-binding protein
MQLIQTRRELLTSLTVAGAVGLLGARPVFAEEPPPETTTIRFQREELDSPICNAPVFVAEELLRAEGFTDVKYVVTRNGPELTQAFEHGKIDFAFVFAPGAVRRLDDGVPITVVAGVHPGCFELFVNNPVRTVADLKGRRSCSSRSWRRTSGSTPKRTSSGSRGTMLPSRWSCSFAARSMRTSLS